MEIVEIIDEISERINKQIAIYWVQELDEPNTYLMQVDRTLWLNDSREFVIGVNVYKVLSFVRNTSITVFGLEAPPVGSFTLNNKNFTGDIVSPSPNVLIGKYEQVNSLLATIPEPKPTPIIWVVSPIKSQLVTDVYSALDYKIRQRMFFAAPSNWGDWDEREDTRQVINPMIDLLNAFIASANKHPLVSFLNIDSEIIQHSRLQRLNDYKGGDAIFGDKYSGIEVFLNFEIRKETRNFTFQTAPVPPTPPIITKALMIGDKALIINTNILIL